MSPQMRTSRRGVSRPSRYRAVQLPVVIWLSLVWYALWGGLTPLVLVSGPLVAVAVCVVFPLPPLRFSGRIRPRGLAVLLGRFAVDVARASGQVAVVTLRHSRRNPPAPLRNAVIEVDLVSESDFVLTGVSLMLSLVPGSVLIEARRSTHTLYLHVIDVDDDAGVEAFRRTVLDQEQRILRAFAPREQTPTTKEATP